jgi:hypothetical protein
MHNLLRLYRQNRRKVWTTLIFIVIVIALIQVLNAMAGKDYRQRQEEGILRLDGDISPVLNEEHYAVVSEQEIPVFEAEKDQNIIDAFLKYCNDGNVQDAYNLLTDECKENIFPTIQDFTNNYYSKVFSEKKMCEKQMWVAEDEFHTYRVVLMKDILSTGKIESGSTYTDYYTVVKLADGEQKLNINNYIGRTQVARETAKNNISIQVTSKDIYLDYEIYNTGIKNNSQKTILLDSKRRTNTVFVKDDNDVEYTAYMYEIDETLLRVEPKLSRNISIKFNKVYGRDKELENMNFTDVILDYEGYISDPQNYSNIGELVVGI